MKAGRLRHRVNILGATTMDDGYGGTDKTIATKKTVWAAVEPLRGQKLAEAQQINAKIDTRITMRYNDTIKPDDTLGHGEHRYRVLAIINLQERNIELNLLCERLARENVPEPEEEPDPVPEEEE